MLVFFSDIHLTDGSSGETINAGAFEVFADRLVALAQKRRPHEMQVVLLGDGLDVIRSTRWLAPNAAAKPWDAAGAAQERLVLDVLQAILDRNRQALSHLAGLPQRVASASSLSSSQVGLEYILGNHDWMINRYRSARELVAGALKLAERYITRGFPTEYSSPTSQYDVIARHGDVFDRLNYDHVLGRDDSSLGDAIVIELLNRFPLEVGGLLANAPAGGDVVRSLKEIDNVRPYSRIPAWVADVLAGLAQDDARIVDAARRALDRCIRDFRGNLLFRSFIQRQLRWPERLYLRLLLNQAGRRQIGLLDRVTRLGDRLLTAWRGLCGLPTSEYAAHALAEQGVDGRFPRYVVYGHTHQEEIVPLVLSARGSETRYYLNTGTWRTVWQRTETADRSLHFASWKEMTYAVIYHPDEADGKHEFEMWTGSLRDRLPE